MEDESFGNNPFGDPIEGEPIIYILTNPLDLVDIDEMYDYLIRVFKGKLKIS